MEIGASVVVELVLDMVEELEMDVVIIGMVIEDMELSVVVGIATSVVEIGLDVMETGTLVVIL